MTNKKMEQKLILAAQGQLATYKGQPALFLDRDGVVIEDKHHLCDPQLVELCSGLALV